MAKERIMAIFIGLVMVLSAAGFALNSAINQNPGQVTGCSGIPAIVNRQLAFDEVTCLLTQEGKVIIEFLYADNCTECPGKIASLESFVQKMSGFVVLQEVKGNETSIQIIGAGGDITDLNNVTLSEQNLMATFCDVAIAQPPECLMPE